MSSSPHPPVKPPMPRMQSWLSRRDAALADSTLPTVRSPSFTFRRLPTEQALTSSPLRTVPTMKPVTDGSPAKTTANSPPLSFDRPQRHQGPLVGTVALLASRSQEDEMRVTPHETPCTTPNATSSSRTPVVPAAGSAVRAIASIRSGTSASGSMLYGFSAPLLEQHFDSDACHQRDVLSPPDERAPTPPPPPRLSYDFNGPTPFTPNSSRAGHNPPHSRSGGPMSASLFDDSPPLFGSYDSPTPKRRHLAALGDLSLTVEDAEEAHEVNLQDEGNLVDVLAEPEDDECGDHSSSDLASVGEAEPSPPFATSSSPPSSVKNRDLCVQSSTQSTNPRSPLEEMLGSTFFTKHLPGNSKRLSMSTSAYRVDDDNGNPDTVNNLAFYGKIGAGACGEVFRALDEEDCEEVAVKTLRRPKLGPDYIMEVRVANSMPSHPHICGIREVIDDPENGQAMLVMPLLAGPLGEVDMRDFSCKQLEPEEVCAVAIQIGSALRHCHEHGIIHGDIKPENILRDSRPPRRHSGAHMTFQFPVNCLLADFGAAIVTPTAAAASGAISRRVKGSTGRHLSLSNSGDEELQSTTMQSHEDILALLGAPAHAQGSPAYLSPELLAGGAPSAASDMWAFGVSLYTLLFGTHPFPSEHLIELRHKVTSEALSYPQRQRREPKLRPWRVILDGLLCKDPRERWTAETLMASPALVRAVESLSK